MRRTAMFGGLMAAIFTAAVLAQATPNFAGTWTLVPDANAPAGGRGGRSGMTGFGQQATVTQDAKALTVVRTTQAGEVKSTYNLDGSKSTNTLTFGENSIEQVSVAKWDGPRLVITTSSNFQGNAFETSMRVWLEGGNLVLETTRPDFQGGGAPITTRQTYKKS
jgi:hypothetical protein